MTTTPTEPGTVRPTGHCVTFFAGLFVYVWLLVDPSLLYHGAGLLQFPAFSTDRAFLQSHLVSPGGPTIYPAALLSQCYVHPWAGAAVIVVITALLSLGTARFMAGAAGARVPMVWLVPLLFVLVMCNRYVHDLASLLALLAALSGACAYTMAGRWRGPARLALFLCLFAALYPVAAGACLVYAALCVVLELCRSRAPWARLVGLLAAVSIPYLWGVRLLERPPSDAYLLFLPFHTSADPAGVGLAFSLGLLLFVMGPAEAVRRRMPRARGRSSARKAGIEAPGAGPPEGDRPAAPAQAAPDERLTSREGHEPAKARRLRSRPGARWALAVTVTLLVGLASFDSNRKLPGVILELDAH